MTLADTAVSLYLALNGAIAAGAASLLVLERLAPKMSARSLLRVHYGVAAALLFCVALQALLPQGLLPGGSLLPVDLRALADGVGGRAAPASADPSDGTFDAGSLARLWIATVLVLLASGVAFIARDVYRLRSLLRDSHLVRSQGRVQIRVHDSVLIPFSCWHPRRAHVVLPAYLLQEPRAMRITIAHELQHHRQRDTVWLHFFSAMRVLCFLNPLAHAWVRAARRTQEFACDEALIARRRCSPESYARCLVEIVDRLRGKGQFSGITSCLIGFGDPNSLRRRMEKMFDQSPGPWAKSRVRACVAGACAFMTLVAYTSAGMAGDDVEKAPKTVWPVDGAVLAGFGKHRGLDIAANVGAAVRAYAAGTVLSTEPTKGCQGRVQIRHDTLLGTYCNLSGVAVTPGQTVDAATVIGSIASPAPGVKAHLHFELSEETFIDPRLRLPRVSAAE